MKLTPARMDDVAMTKDSISPVAATGSMEMESVPSEGAKYTREDQTPPPCEDEGESSATPFEGAEENDVPSCFYCPIIKKLLEDPVVVPTGETYERSAILQRGDVPPEKLYANRGLLAIIDERLERTADSRRPAMPAVEGTSGPNENNTAIRPLHDACYCPITMDLMHVPVIDSEGNSFERVAVENWIQVNHNSPITRNKLESTDLYPNKALEDILKDELSKLDQSVYPWAKTWKQEIPDVETQLSQMATSRATHSSGVPYMNVRARLAIRCFWLLVMLLSLILFFYSTGPQLLFLVVFLMSTVCIKVFRVHALRSHH